MRLGIPANSSIACWRRLISVEFGWVVVLVPIWAGRVCLPWIHVRLSTICGVVIARCVWGERQYGPSTFRVDPSTQSSAQMGTFCGFGKLGLDSPNVN